MMLVIVLLTSHMLFVQTSPLEPEVLVNDQTVGSLIQIAEKILTILESLVDKAFRNAIVSMDYIKKELDQIKVKSVEISNTLAKYLDSFILKKLEEIKSKYGQTSKIISCIESHDQLKLLSDKFVNETATCLVVNFGKAIDGFEVIVKDINQTEVQVELITEELHKCNNSSNTKLCVLKVINQLKRAIQRFPEKIKNDAKKAEELILYLRRDSVECYNTNFDSAEDAAFDMLASIVECTSEAKPNETLWI